MTEIKPVAAAIASTFCSTSRRRDCGVESKMSSAPDSSSPRVMREPASTAQMPSTTGTVPMILKVM